MIRNVSIFAIFNILLLRNEHLRVHIFQTQNVSQKSDSAYKVLCLVRIDILGMKNERRTIVYQAGD